MDEKAAFIKNKKTGLSEKRSTVHFIASIWVKANNLEGWDQKEIYNTALMHFLGLSRDEQWQAYRKYHEYITEAIKKTTAGPPDGKE